MLKNTDLYDSYVKGDFEPLTVEQAVDICASVVDIFNKHSIKIIRLGLLLADDEAKNNFVAGPYHPRFAELVRKRC